MHTEPGLVILRSFGCIWFECCTSSGGSLDPPLKTKEFCGNEKGWKCSECDDCPHPHPGGEHMQGLEQFCWVGGREGCGLPCCFHWALWRALCHTLAVHHWPGAGQWDQPAESGGQDECTAVQEAPSPDICL